MVKSQRALAKRTSQIMKWTDVKITVWEVVLGA